MKLLITGNRNITLQDIDISDIQVKPYESRRLVIKGITHRIEFKPHYLMFSDRGEYALKWNQSCGSQRIKRINKFDKLPTLQEKLEYLSIFINRETAYLEPTK